MNRFYFLLVLLIACSNKPVQDTSSPKLHDETVTQVTPSWYHPPRAVRTELKSDTRSPAEITAAACRGPNGQWFCNSPQPRASSATAVGPIIPPSWTIPQWYVDPSNTSGAASDNNNCTTTSTPCLTWHEINDHRWGCIGSPNACPRLRQNTNITFISSHTTTSDPVYFYPSIENSAYVVLQGAAPTVVATVSLSGVTAKSTTAGANSLLIANIGGSGAANMLLENTTHPSRAWAYASFGGGSFSITQPMVKLTTPFSSTPPAEVNTWANTDSVKLLTPVSVNLVAAVPVYTDFNNSSGGFNLLNIYQLLVFNPAASADQSFVGTFVSTGEVNWTRVININQGFNNNSNSFVNYNTLLAGSVDSSSSFWVFGGEVSGAISGNGGNALLDGDVIINGGGWQQYGGEVIWGRVYMDAASLVFSGTMDLIQEFYAPAVIYGNTGKIINVEGSSRFANVGQTFVNAFTAPSLVTGIELNGVATACSSTGGATPTIACGISTTPAHLDAAAGAAGFGGMAFNLGGASVGNTQ